MKIDRNMRSTFLSPSRNLKDRWYRLVRTDDGLMLESASDFGLRAARARGQNYSEPWEWVADVPDTIAARLPSAPSPDQVAEVLNATISAMIEGAH